MTCIVCGKEDDRHICDSCWPKLPLKLRQRWWDETEYGGREPTAELIANVTAEGKAH